MEKKFKVQVAKKSMSMRIRNKCNHSIGGFVENLKDLFSVESFLDDNGQEIEVELIECARDISVILKYHIVQKGLRPATIEEVLAVAEKYHDWPNEFRIFALGLIEWKKRTFPWYPYPAGSMYPVYSYIGRDIWGDRDKGEEIYLGKSTEDLQKGLFAVVRK